VNKDKNLLKIILVLMFASQIMFAKITAGDINKGDKVSIVPLQGHALSITKKEGFYGDGFFNFTILNNQDIIYEDKDQKDDVYLVFHDSIEEGDRVEIDVTKGQYHYEITNLVTLPELVLDALKDTPEVELKVKKEIEEIAEKPTEKEKLEKSIPDPISLPPLVEENIVEKKEQISAPLKDTPMVEKKEEIVPEGSSSFLDQLSAVLGRLFGFSKDSESEDKNEIETSKNIEDETLPIEEPIKVLENIQEKKSIITPKIEPEDSSTKDKEYEVKLEKEAETMFLERRLSVPTQNIAPTPTPPLLDTGYKNEYKDIEDKVKKNEKIIIESNPIEVQKEIVPTLQERVVEKPKKVESLPQIDTKKEEEPKFTEEKIVITKIIDKEVNNNVADNTAPSSLDDRVLGNRYQERKNGKLGMKVYKNSRPVTAWIEVFKSGTRERVKTFYTKRGSIPKSVKLPAGTYLVKATYRSPTTKHQKSLKNVVIEEGRSVNKKIAFYDGTLKVKVTKDGVPVYAKVVAYKSGSRKIASYAFSNKLSGSCSLILENGRYDIKVSNYRDKKSLTGISIKSGKTKNIKVEF